MAETEGDSTLKKPFPELDQPRERSLKPSLNRALEESFARVRQDMTRIKEVLNEQAEQIRLLNSKVEGFVNMYEFFEYMQRIDSQFESFNRGFMRKEAFETHLKEITGRMRELDSLLDRDSEMKGELRELEKKGAQQEPEKRELVAQVHGELNKLDADVIALKKSLNRQRKLEYEMTKQFGGVENLAKAIQRMEKELRENAEVIEGLKRRIAAEEGAVERDMEQVRGSAAAQPAAGKKESPKKTPSKKTLPH